MRGHISASPWARNLVGDRLDGLAVPDGLIVNLLADTPRGPLFARVSRREGDYMVDVARISGRVDDVLAKLAEVAA